MTRHYKVPSELNLGSIDFEEAADNEGLLGNAARSDKYREHHRDRIIAGKQKEIATRHARRDVKPIVGFDGEGATVNDAHRYVLIRVGDETLIEHPSIHSSGYIISGGGLTWSESLDWLCHVQMGNEIVAFAADYDFTMIIRDYILTNEFSDIRRLVTTGRAFLHDRKSDIGWVVEYRPRMEIGISPIRRCKPDDPAKHGNPCGWCSAVPRNACQYCGKPADPSRGHGIRISDTIKLFQTSFVRVLDDWNAGTEQQRIDIRDGKDRREVIKFIDPDECQQVYEYNKLEMILLAEVMTEFRQACHDAGLYPMRLQSPGYVAAAAFLAHNIPTRAELEERFGATDWQKFAVAAMYGGRFESAMFGPVPQNSKTAFAHHGELLVTEYDRASAYPHYATKLPCLRCSTWEHRAPRPGEIALQHAYVSYDRPVDRSWHPRVPDVAADPQHPVFMGVPHRNPEHGISFPLEAEGVWWNFELAEARHQNVEVLASWTWVAADCGHDMFGFIRELYALRKSLGGNKGKPIKLAINSIYGKLAQKVGSKKYTNYAAASFITAQMRADLMRTIHETSCEVGLQCGSNVIFTATDAIVFISDPGLPYAKKEEAQLGDWTRKEYPNGLFIVQPGVYWPQGADEAQSKTRGVPQSILHEHIPDFETAYAHMVETGVQEDSKVTLRYRRTPDGERVEAQSFTGVVEAVYRSGMHAKYCKVPFGLFHKYERILGIEWRLKRRYHPQYDGDITPSADKPFATVPKTVDNPQTTYYDPDIKMPWYGVPTWLGEDNIIAYIRTDPDWLDLNVAPIDEEIGDDASRWSPDD